jgi:hypothetical protein
MALTPSIAKINPIITKHKAGLISIAIKKINTMPAAYFLILSMLVLQNIKR